MPKYYNFTAIRYTHLQFWQELKYIMKIQFAFSPLGVHYSWVYETIELGIITANMYSKFLNIFIIMRIYTENKTASVV
jgi:hypothetical protein